MEQKEYAQGTPVVDRDLDIPQFNPKIPSYLIKKMDDHNKFLLEQISIMKQQNEWQTDLVSKIYNYTKTINGKVVELENFRHRIEIEMELDSKWDKREQKLDRLKKWGLIIFLSILYPLYLSTIDLIGLDKLLENILKL